MAAWRTKVDRFGAEVARPPALCTQVVQGTQRRRFYEQVASNATEGSACGRAHAHALRPSEQGLVALSSVLRGRPPRCASDEWVEVMRQPDANLGWQQQREGHGDYGCWFAPALGSGIFLNLGRTRLLYKKGDVGALYDDWRTRRGGDVAADESSELARLQGVPRGEAFPLMAADLSYDSVVLLHNSVSRALWSSNPGL